MGNHAACSTNIIKHGLSREISNKLCVGVGTLKFYFTWNSRDRFEVMVTAIPMPIFGNFQLYS